MIDGERPGHHARVGEDVGESALHVADAMRHAGQIGMAGDGHDLRPLLRLRIEALEVVHGPVVEFLGVVVLQVHHDDVVHLEGVGQRHDLPVPGLERDGIVVEHVVADVLHTGLGQVVERVEGLRQPRPEPAARALAGEGLDDLHGLEDDAALVVQLVHGDLLVGVRVELPAAVHAGFDHGRIGLADPGVDGDRGPGADA